MVFFTSLVALGGCSDDGAALDTGLTGVVLRGPTAPVCDIAEPCDAPFAATFVVSRSGRRITDFRSAGDGRFEVLLSPGSYRVTPAPDAPLLDPASQGADVVVGPAGLTTDTLHFDTGIR
jgi:hypothetical protein